MAGPVLQRYAAALDSGALQPDAAQQTAVAALDELALALRQTPAPPPADPPRWKRLRRRWLGRHEPVAAHWPQVPGLYLWGGVGRGKTHLMDLFHAELSGVASRRAHFHTFMRELHAALKQHRRQQDPLLRIADTLASQHQVICFDEFFVEDITDAMLLGTLFTRLFEHGVTLVATSNVAPDDLYTGGLQRERFLPAIGQLKRHCRVLHLADGPDYRQTAAGPVDRWLPAGEVADAQLATLFRQRTGRPPAPATLQVQGRPLPARAVAEGIAWFDFATLCEGPRSQQDYLELAERFATLLLSNIPRLTATRDNAARRFINLIDVLYDAGGELYASAADQPAALYAGERLRFPFARTASRLQELRAAASATPATPEASAATPPSLSRPRPG